jgi:hypothetical protein
MFDQNSLSLTYKKYKHFLLKQMEYKILLYSLLSILMLKAHNFFSSHKTRYGSRWVAEYR